MAKIARVLLALALVATAVTLIGCGGGGGSVHKDTVELANGVKMPLMAAGTWQYNDTVAEQTVVDALKSGFKHIDTAHDYGNQVGVGKGLARSGLKREDIFITSKVPGCGLQGLYNNDCYNNTLAAIKQDLAQINISYLDLLLIHFPPCMTATGNEKSPMDTQCHASLNGCSDRDNCAAIAQQWKAVEEAHSGGLLKAVGVSNYCSACFKCLGNTSLMPMVNQVQMHVGMGADPQGFLSYAKKNKMVLMAWSPLGSGGHGNHDILEGNLTTSIAKAHNKTSAQVALKWLVQHGASVATKSSNPVHLKQDVAMFDWTLTAEEMASLDVANFAKHDTPSFMCSDADPKRADVVVVV